MMVFCLQRREAFRVRDLVRRDVEQCGAVLEAHESHQVAPFLRFLSFRIQPDAQFGSGRDLLASRVNVLVPRDFLARHDDLAGAVHVAIVALADGPFHQRWTTIDAVVDTRCRGRFTRPVSAPGAAVDRLDVLGVQHLIGNRVMQDLATLDVRWTDFDHSDPSRLGESGDVYERDATTRPGAGRASSALPTSRRCRVARSRPVPLASTGLSRPASVPAGRRGCPAARRCPPS